MTDERFIRKIIEEVASNFKKSEEQRDKELTSLIIPYSKREYERIKEEKYYEICVKYDNELIKKGKDKRNKVSLKKKM